ncbi:hypothetical protein CEQ90_19555 [Lewinellaceae bacterium SD302]|nr:hypothetical protein CEQ90_19555 [Lewinellaceae bacterium SD302]
MVTKNDWNFNPMSSKRITVGIDIVFSSSDYQKLRNGFLPIDFGDRWFIFFDIDVLNICQWNGDLIYQLKIMKIGRLYKGLTLTIAQDDKIKPILRIDKEVATVKLLISKLLIGKYLY